MYAFLPFSWPGSEGVTWSCPPLSIIDLDLPCLINGLGQPLLDILFKISELNYIRVTKSSCLVQ